MGCKSVLNLAATPDEAVSIICTIIDKTILLTLWGKLMYVSYTTDRPVFSRASFRCSSGIVCLWVLLTWLTYAYGMLCQDDVAPGKVLLFQCTCQLFFGLGTSTHVCL
jgi:hypothetical protein